MYLFVYGTLKKNFDSHQLLKDSKFIDNAYIYGSLFELTAGFPAVCLDGGRDHVYGEVYDIDEFEIDEIDQYEGFNPDDPSDSIYLRLEADAYIAKNKTIKVSVYVMDDKQISRFLAIPVRSGKWVG